MKNAGVLLSLLHREHPDVLCVRLVWQLHSCVQKSTPEGHLHRPESHRPPSPISGRTLQFPLPQKSKVHFTGRIPLRTLIICTASLRQKIQDSSNQDKQTKEQFLSESHHVFEYFLSNLFNLLTYEMNVRVCVCLCFYFCNFEFSMFCFVLPASLVLHLILLFYVQ